MQTNKILFEYTFLGQNGKQKNIRVIHGDLTKIDSADVVVCSAFQGDYYPMYGTLIGALWRNKNIMVKDLARNPEIDLRSMGCWISEELEESDFKRVACVELYGRKIQGKNGKDYLLQTGFSTLAYLIDQCAMRDIPVGTIALPILASGDQNIAFEYVIAPLIKHCMRMLMENDGVETLLFCEMDGEKAGYLAEALKKHLTTLVEKPQVFISYSTKNAEYAFQLRDGLAKAGIRCWIAPDSIPTGSNYLEEIPLALSSAPVFALILTPDAETSKWVPKELEVAIDTQCALIPIQMENYKMGLQFRFALAAEQIFPAWQYSVEEAVEKVTQIIAEKLK